MVHQVNRKPGQGEEDRRTEARDSQGQRRVIPEQFRQAEAAERTVDDGQQEHDLAADEPVASPSLSRKISTGAGARRTGQPSPGRPDAGAGRSPAADPAAWPRGPPPGCAPMATMLTTATRITTINTIGHAVRPLVMMCSELMDKPPLHCRTRHSVEEPATGRCASLNPRRRETEVMRPNSWAAWNPEPERGERGEEEG